MTGEPFNFWNEKTASDLDSLVYILSDMSYEEFSSYVNQSKNDFANWIDGSLENKELAEKIRPLLEKDLIRAVISDFLGKQTNKLIIGTSHAIQEDSLVKEIMQKNEDFFKEVKREYKEEEKDEKNEKENAEKSNSDDFNLKSESPKENETETKAGSKITFMDISKVKAHPSKELLVGLFFGLAMGALLMLIIQQIIVMW